MGLTSESMGIHSIDSEMLIKRKSPNDKIIALAGNPNVGKSTVFNGLTGMNQHTGNWPGKTVVNVQGYCATQSYPYILVDLPGTYSLLARSAEEEVARNFICSGAADAIVVVCDATCLERNLNLVLQILEITQNVIVCVNLMDEAKKKHIHIDLDALSICLGVPVVGTAASKKKTLTALTNVLDKQMDEAINIEVKAKKETLLNEPQLFKEDELTQNILMDSTVSKIYDTAHTICQSVVTFEKENYNALDRKLDRIFTSKWAGYPIMLCLLAVIFWLTIVGANYPSELIASGLFWIQEQLTHFFHYINAPAWLHGVLVLGIYRVVAWVVSVMLPPMAIFFPLFTLLEDSGYLPRIAYNLDKPFRCCHACGKQALTMCMGFGCNAAGIVGCRIIDSPRERLLAILTNNFVPCNGRFPTLIAILSMFFIVSEGAVLSSLLSALLLTLLIVLGILITFLITRLLSQTLLKGLPSSFTLELPSYRKPLIGKVIIRSIFDRTLFVLGRAMAVAPLAGMILWIMANVYIGDMTMLNHCAAFLDPFAKFMGLDGVILIAFILGFPANEIVIPIIIMAYMAQGSLLELESLVQMKELFVNNGWTWITAICTMLFSLMHWPCSTTLLTIKKETGSWKWTALAALIPTVTGILVCIIVAGIGAMFV